MKLRHFFFAAMLIGGFAACSDEENLGGVDNGSSEVNAYMTLQIVGPQGMGTKTDGDPSGTTDPADPESGDYVTGTDAENKISSVTVLLCNTNNQTVSYIYDISDLETLSNGGVRTPVIATTTGEYSVYVIANRPSSLSISAGDDVNEKLIEYVSESSMKETYAKDNSFLMFSECNGTDKIGGTSISITSSNDYDHPATCETIELDRLAVKIQSQAEKVDITEITKEGGEFNAISGIALQGFKLLNGATGAYLQQHWSNATTEQGNYPWYSQLNTPNLTNSSTGYYNHLTNFRTIATQEGSTDVYTAAKDLYAEVPYYNTTNNMASIYCMENNPTTDLNGNTTGLIYQWKATLTENASDGYAGLNGFYWYGGTYYSKLADIQKDYPNVFEKATGADAQAKLAAAQGELQTAYNNGTIDQDKMSTFRAKYKIKVYVDGIMYYTYFIKDQNYKYGSNATSAAPYYSVMRNTIYDLTVTKLARIGTDIPGGWNPDVDPEDPVDPTNVYMVVQATVNPWVVSSEDITLD